jgi:hypothetical protein
MGKKRTASLQIICIAFSDESSSNARDFLTSLFEVSEAQAMVLDVPDEPETYRISIELPISYLSEWNEIRSRLDARDSIDRYEAFVSHPALRGKTRIWPPNID